MAINHVYTQTVADGTATSVVRPSDWNSAHAVVFNISGNTVGVSQVTGTDVVFNAGANITLSGDQANNQIIISGGAGGPGGGIALQAGTQTAPSGTVVFSNSNGISFGMSNSSVVTASYTVPSVPAQTQQPMYFSASGTSSSANTIPFGNSNGVSFSLSNGSIVGTVKTDYQSSGNYLTTAMASDAGSNFVGLNSALTGNGVSATINSSGISLNVPGFLTTAAQSSQTLGFSLSGNIATTNSSRISNGAYALAGGNGVTIQQSNNTVSISVATNYQSQGAYLTTADLSANSSNYVSAYSLVGANTAGTTTSAVGVDLYLSGGQGITLSGNQRTVVFSVGSYITTGALSQDSSKYAGTNGAITGGSLTVNTSGVSINLPAYLTTADLSGNSSNYMSAWSLVGAHTAGTTTSAQGVELYLSGGANITLSGNSNTIVISAAGGGGTTNQTGPNIADVNGNTITNGTVVFSNSNGVSFGLNGSTMTASVVAAQPSLSTYVPITPGGSTASQTFNTMGSVSAAAFVVPFVASVPIAFNVINAPIFVSNVSSSRAFTQSVSHSYGIYSNNVGSLSLISSGSFSYALTGSSTNATLSYPASTGTGGYTYTTVGGAGTANQAATWGQSFTREYGMQFGNSVTLSAGAYWLGIVQVQSSSSANGGLSMGLVGAVVNMSGYAPIGQTNNQFDTAYRAPYVGLGQYNANTGAMPASMSLNQIAQSVSVLPYLSFLST